MLKETNFEINDKQSVQWTAYKISVWRVNEQKIKYPSAILESSTFKDKTLGNMFYKNIPN